MTATRTTSHLGLRLAIPLLLPLFAPALPAAAQTVGTKGTAPSAYSIGSRIALWNDFFSGMGKDDSGFTNDMEFQGFIRTERTQSSLSFRHRMITERSGPSRVDMIDVTARLRLDLTRNGLRAFFSPHAGASTAGNLGGSKIQDWFHRLPVASGRTLQTGLQFRYAGDIQTALLLGSSIGFDWEPSPPITLLFASSFQVALGKTGVSWVSGAAALSFQPVNWILRPELTAGLAVSSLSTRDERLTMSGGYSSGQPYYSPRARVAIHLGRFTLAWELRLNEGGAGQATAALALEYNCDRAEVNRAFIMGL